MTQPLPDNLHQSQCYRLLAPKRDTLQARDQVLFRLGHNGWEWQEIDMCRYGESPQKNHVYRRPFTPPAPVQVQEFWRLLEAGEATRQGDWFFSSKDEWISVESILFGLKVIDGCRPIRRRVTVPVAAPAPVADAPKAEPSGDYAAYRERLFKYMWENFGRTLINSEMDEIEHIVLGYFKHKAHEPIPEPPESGPYLVSVDGHKAPTMEHATIEEARTEAERLARQEHPAQVRLLRQVAVAKADVTVKWEKQ